MLPVCSCHVSCRVAACCLLPLVFFVCLALVGRSLLPALRRSASSCRRRCLCVLAPAFLPLSHLILVARPRRCIAGVGASPSGRPFRAAVCVPRLFSDCLASTSRPRGCTRSLHCSHVSPPPVMPCVPLPSASLRCCLLLAVGTSSTASLVRCSPSVSPCLVVCPVLRVVLHRAPRSSAQSFAGQCYCFFRLRPPAARPFPMRAPTVCLHRRGGPARGRCRWWSGELPLPPARLLFAALSLLGGCPGAGAGSLTALPSVGTGSSARAHTPWHNTMAIVEDDVVSHPHRLPRAPGPVRLLGHVRRRFTASPGLCPRRLSCVGLCVSMCVVCVWRVCGGGWSVSVGVSCASGSLFLSLPKPGLRARAVHCGSTQTAAWEA